MIRSLQTSQMRQQIRTVNFSETRGLSRLLIHKIDEYVNVSELKILSVIHERILQDLLT